MKLMTNNLLMARVYQLRIAQGLLQKVVAQGLGIAPPLYSKIEKGERSLQYEYLKPLSSILNVDVKEFSSLWLTDKILYYAPDVSTDVVSEVALIIKKIKNDNK